MGWWTRLCETDHNLETSLIHLALMFFAARLIYLDISKQIILLSVSTISLQRLRSLISGRRKVM
jgi:hypothetical protein